VLEILALILVRQFTFKVYAPATQKFSAMTSRLFALQWNKKLIANNHLTS